MRVIVCGDRHWSNRVAIHTVLKHFPAGTTIVHGAAPGVLAGEVAKELGFKVERYPAHWKHNDKCPADCRRVVGKAAGPIRNADMLRIRPDKVVAFHKDIDASRGTKGMLQLAEAAGVPCCLFSRTIQWRSLDLPLRTCPACADSEYPVRFKQGVRVWEGKRLRVCSTKCSRAVRREVKRLRLRYPGVDRERARRSIAWRYMRKGGQT